MTTGAQRTHNAREAELPDLGSQAELGSQKPENRRLVQGLALVNDTPSSVSTAGRLYRKSSPRPCGTRRSSDWMIRSRRSRSSVDCGVSGASKLGTLVKSATSPEMPV